MPDEAITPTDTRAFAAQLATELRKQGIEIPPGEYLITKVEKALRSTLVALTEPVHQTGYQYHDKTRGVLQEPTNDPGFNGINPEYATAVSRVVRSFTFIITSDWRAKRP